MMVAAGACGGYDTADAMIGPRSLAVARRSAGNTETRRSQGAQRSVFLCASREVSSHDAPQVVFQYCAFKVDWQPERTPTQ